MANKSEKRLLRHSTRTAIAGGAFGIALLCQTAFSAACRPLVTNGTIKTADGQLLRGCCAHIAKGASEPIRKFFTDLNNVIKLRDQAHMNTIRICCLVPGWGGYTIRDSTVPYVDAIVANCEAAGIYAMINYHGVPQLFDGSSMDIHNFWKFYSARYKDKPFVIYEIENEILQDPPVSATDWMIPGEVDYYKILRGNAPNNMITGFLEPVCEEHNWGPGIKDYFAPAAGIDWTAQKDVWAFHTYLATTAPPILATRNYGVPLICTEFSIPEEGWGNGDVGGCHFPGEWCERNGISWIVWQQWQSKEPDQLKSIINYILPDATSKKWAWWSTVAVDPSIRQSARVHDAFISHGSTKIQANGRVLKTSGSSLEKPWLWILPDNVKMSRNQNKSACAAPGPK